MSLEKISVFYFRIFTGIHYCGKLYACPVFFYFFKYIINTNSLVTLLLAVILGYLGDYYIVFTFNIKWDVFSAKLLAFLNSGIFTFLTGLEKKGFKISDSLASCVKVLLPYTNVVFSENFV